MAVAQIIWAVAFAEQRDTNALESAEQSTLILPDIGNTDAQDRLLSREVSDTFVYGQNDSEQPVSVDNKHSNLLDPETVSADGTDTVSGNRNIDKTPTMQVSSNGGPTVESNVGNAKTLAATKSPTPNSLNKPIPDDSVWKYIISSDRLPLKQQERVTFYVNQYQRESLWINKILRRGEPFLAHMVTTLDQRFLPMELALLPAIESGFRPTAKSGGNALGLWQIVPITAKEIGLARNAWFDGRGDVITSTTAAIDYLSYLNAEFDGDWELTLAAYNAGPGRIRAAIRKNKKQGLPTDYWSLDLPEETRNYVPKLTALITLLKMPNQGGLDLPELAMEPAFESIDIGFRVSLDRAAQIADVDLDFLRNLNAGLIHGVTAPQGPHFLLIPTGSGEKFQQAFSAIDRKTAFSVPNTHNVAVGDTISSIALKYGLTQSELLSMNGLDDTKIRIGQKLAVLGERKLSETVVEYVVTIGDTLSEIAHKFSVNVQDITLSTGEALSNDVIRPGDTLSININTPTSG